MKISKILLIDIKNSFKKQSKISYGLFFSILSVFLSILSILTWFFENSFFVARPSESALWSSLVVFLICSIVWFRLWLLSLHIMYPKGYVRPTKSRDSWIRGSIILVLLSTLPNAYFIGPYDSHIMSYLFVIISLLNLLSLYLFKNFYISAESNQRKWLGRIMIFKSIHPSLSQFVPR